LAEVGRLIGWAYDYCEVRDFIEGIHRTAGKEIPDLEPYEIID
jgi:hypothetical protein